MNILLAFLTGLTTGGLSCLAVQGGLLASSLANQLEQDLQQAPRPRQGSARPAETQHGGALARPIVAFLLAKLLAYTALGLLLGAVGQAFQLSPFTRAFLQIAIGVFMLGSALRMLNVHPIFRYFAFEPPAFLRRRLRQQAKAGGASLVTPVVLGLLTVFIPCGITQAMMAAALATADPLQAAALMFAFTLGTSPVFFAVAYFATQLGSRLEKWFTRAIAVVVLLAGLLTIDTGLTLAGAPMTLTRWWNDRTGAETALAASETNLGVESYGPALNTPAPAVTTSDAALGDDVLTVNITNRGYEPKTVNAPAGKPLRLRLVSQDTYTCALAFTIPSLNIQEVLDSTDEAWVEIPAQEAGTNMLFSCSMGMYTGQILFE